MSLPCIKHGTETASFLGHRKLLGMQYAQSAEEHSEMKLRLGQNPVGVEASEVVPRGVQIGSLDQLQGQQPAESELYLMPSPIL